MNRVDRGASPDRRREPAEEADFRGMNVDHVRTPDQAGQPGQGSSVADRRVTARRQLVEAHPLIVGEALPEDRRTRTSHFDRELVPIEAGNHVEDVLWHPLGERLRGDEQPTLLAGHGFNSIL